MDKAFFFEEAGLLRHSRYHIPHTSCHGLAKAIQLDGRPYTLYLYRNTASAADEEAWIRQHVHRLEEEGQKGLDPDINAHNARDYAVTGNASPIEEYERNHGKISEMMELSGMFCLISNTKDMSPEEALQVFERRAMVEKAFQNLKNGMDEEGFLTHSEKTTEGKAFVAFLSLILWSDLLNHGKNSGEKFVARLVKQMGAIRRRDYGSGRSLLQPLIKEQEEILGAFAMEPEKFTETILGFEL